jgi:hypothetical protein
MTDMLPKSISASNENVVRLVIEEMPQPDETTDLDHIYEDARNRN